VTYLASSAGALVVDRNNWHTNANTAYDSGVWGSGTHWQSRWSTTNTALTNMTADRDNWQSSSNTWQSRANTAWGASRVWNSGESWEAAYNRVLPPASPAILSTAFSGSTPTSMQDVAVLTVNRTGYWILTALIGSLSLSTNTDVGLRFRYGGSFGAQGLLAFKGPVATNVGWGADDPQLVTNGTQVAFQINASSSQPYSGGTFKAVFVPTSTYPR